MSVVAVTMQKTGHEIRVRQDGGEPLEFDRGRSEEGVTARIPKARTGPCQVLALPWELSERSGGADSVDFVVPAFASSANQERGIAIVTTALLTRPFDRQG